MVYSMPITNKNDKDKVAYVPALQPAEAQSELILSQPQVEDTANVKGLILPEQAPLRLD